MLRAGPVLEIVPKPPLVTTVDGALKFARLKALNISAWSRSLTFSVIENCLRMEKSQSCKFGPITFPTPLFPRRVQVAEERYPVVVGGDEDVPAVKRRRAVAQVAVEGVVPDVHVVPVAARVRE